MNRSSKTAFPDERLTLFEVREMWDVLSPDEQIEAFELLDRPSAQEFLFTLSRHKRAAFILQASEAERLFWMRQLPPDEAADIIQQSPKKQRSKLLELLDERTRREVQALLTYKADVAGGLMNTRFAQVRPDQTIDEAIHYLRLQAKDYLESIFYVFVLDQGQRLLGVVSFQELFRAPQERKISEIMKTEVVTVPENQNQEIVARLFNRYKFIALPVVDHENKIKGIITADDILGAVQEEATEDMQKVGGMEALDQPYLQIDFWTMLKKRAGWLAALFIGEMLTASAMAHYEEEIARAVVLALFVPLIISSGGNSGSQAATLIIRAMALGEVRLRNWWNIVRREFLTGLGLGCVLATIGLARILLWQLIFHTYGAHYFLVALSVCLSLIGVVVWGTTVGAMLPMLLRRLGCDPASASAPFVATLVDVSGIVIYFTVSAVILHNTLL
ncbi:MAG TPA: magnesium transporter [Candidatus Omnitrophota bacterium]|nr:magnesium transporter [Candidatus Omnitrophota bacterium]